MPRNASSSTILLVDDEPLVALDEAAILKKHGYEVLTAYDAEAAMQRFSEHDIDLILMDIDLGSDRMDGAKAADVILREKTLPIVFLTGHTEKEYVDRVKSITNYGYVLKTAGEFVLIESITMAFKLFKAQNGWKKTEKTLVENQKLFDEALQLAHIGVWTWDAAEDRVVWSDELYRIAGRDPKMPPPTYAEHPGLYSEESWHRLDAAVRSSLQTGQKYRLDLELVRPDGSIRSVIAVGGARHNQHKETIALYGILNDVTEYRTAKSEQEKSERFLNAALNGLTANIALLDDRGEIIFVNEAWREFAVENGVSAEDVSEGVNYLRVCDEATGDSSEGADQFAQAVRDILNGEIGSFSLEYPCHSPDVQRWFVGKVSPIRIEDNNYVVVAHENITELKKSVEEKKLLMKELNHRVKNNLIMVRSLVNLKDSALGDRVDLSDLALQIDTIRIVHEKLFQSEDFTGIDVEDYISDLLSTVFSFSSRSVSIEKKITVDRLQTRTGISLGLLINEIATNAVKHGFTTEGEACFRVEFRADADRGCYLLALANTGRPFPEEIVLENPGTLGLRLITALVSQLNGTIRLQRKPYPLFHIEFPIPK